MRESLRGLDRPELPDAAALRFRLRSLTVGVLAVGASLALVGAAQAVPAVPIAIDLLPSNNNLGIYLKVFPQNLGELSVDLDNATNVHTATGEVGSPAATANFASTSAIDAANGHATIKANAHNAVYHDLTITLSPDDNYTGAFDDLVFGVQLDKPEGSNPFDLTIQAFNVSSLLGSLTLSSNDNPANDDFKQSSDMSFLVLGENAHLITKVVLSSTSGFKDTKQFAFSGLQATPEPVPLPASALLLGPALGGLGFLSRLRRKKVRQ